VEDIRGSDAKILAPTALKNVGQLTYRQISQTVKSEFQARERIETRWARYQMRKTLECFQIGKNRTT
jgi:hypothetical protein